MTHDFHTSLAASRAPELEAWWQRAYRRLLTGVVVCAPNETPGLAQRRGIDRMILCQSCELHLVEEKARGRDYQDVLLEYLSVDKTGEVGWMQKDLWCCHLAYAFPTTGLLLWIDYWHLRQAWGRFHKEWFAAYKPIEADNGRYVTKSLAIPFTVLEACLGDHLCHVQIEPLEAPMIP